MATEHEQGGTPPGDTVDEVAAAVAVRFPGTVVWVSHGQPVVYVDRAAWRGLAVFLRDAERFTQCLDVTAVDHLVDEERAAVPGVTRERCERVPNFLSDPPNRRLRPIPDVP